MPGLWPNLTAYSHAVEQLGIKNHKDPTIVAGFAGGVGLSGDVCGALAATLFAIGVRYFEERNKPKHGMLRSNMQGMNMGNGWMNPMKELSKDFQQNVREKFCRDIAERKFHSSQELSDFLESGGCDHVLETLKECL
jgi:hypothetical protein